MKKIIIVAGRNETKNVRLTALNEPNRYLDKTTMLALNSVATRTSEVPVTEPDRLKL
jgi:hypothetical protein